MNVGLLGTSHKRASLTEIESVYIGKELQAKLIEKKDQLGIDELVILATCNRLEIYFISDSLSTTKDNLQQWISTQKDVEPEAVERIFEFKTEKEAIHHLFSVASGLESMVFGENEILTQVKDAYTIYQEKGLTAAELNKVFQTAIAVGKRVRTETDISKGAYSVSSIAIEAIRENMLDYFGRKILVIGLGVMGRRSLKKLLALGHPNLTIANRTDEKAEAFAKKERINFIPYLSAFDTVHQYDIVLTAVSSKTNILTKEQFDRSDTITELIVDLGLPRNATDEITSNINLISVDGLKAIADKNVKARREEIEAVNVIIDEEMTNLYQWAKGRAHALAS